MNGTLKQRRMQQLAFTEKWIRATRPRSCYETLWVIWWSRQHITFLNTYYLAAFHWPCQGRSFPFTKFAVRKFLWNFQFSVGRKLQLASCPFFEVEGWDSIFAFFFIIPLDFSESWGHHKSSQGRRTMWSQWWFCRLTVQNLTHTAVFCSVINVNHLDWKVVRRSRSKNWKLVFRKQIFNRCLKRGKTWWFLGPLLWLASRLPRTFKELQQTSSSNHGV